MAITSRHAVALYWAGRDGARRAPLLSLRLDLAEPACFGCGVEAGPASGPETERWNADLFLEYSEASDNIERHGVIVQHPRTMNPIENPYLSRRDKSRAELLRLRVSADWLWSAGAADGTDGVEHG